MEEVLKRLSAQEKAIGFVGSTVVQTEQLLRDLEVLDTQARVSSVDNLPNLIYPNLTLT